MIEIIQAIADIIDRFRPSPQIILVLDLGRILFYMAISIVSTWLFFEDYHRGPSRRLIWLGGGLEHGMVLLLLALDLRSLVIWMETRWILTPFASFYAIALVSYAYNKYKERHKLLALRLQQETEQLPEAA